MRLEEVNIQIKKKLVLALDRTGIIDVENEILNKISFDITQNFKHLDLSFLLEAINEGGLGKYGRSYRFSVQEVCLWIYSKLKIKETEIYNPSDHIPR